MASASGRISDATAGPRLDIATLLQLVMFESWVAEEETLKDLLQDMHRLNEAKRKQREYISHMKSAKAEAKRLMRDQYDRFKERGTLQTPTVTFEQYEDGSFKLRQKRERITSLGELEACIARMSDTLRRITQKADEVENEDIPEEAGRREGLLQKLADTAAALRKKAGTTARRTKSRTED